MSDSRVQQFVPFKKDGTVIKTKVAADSIEINGNANVIQPVSDSTTAFTIKDADGGTAVVTVDTTNEAVGIGIAPVVGTKLTLPQENDVATPTLAFGDGNTGLYETADDSLSVTVGGVEALRLIEDTTVEIRIAKNDSWLSTLNYAGTDVVNMLKVNVDDEIDVGGTLNLGGSIEAAEDSGVVTLTDMPVSATPTAGDEMSFTQKIDGTNVLTVGANADSAGGVTGEFVKNHGAVMMHKTDAGAADYNPSILTSDYIITVNTTAAARAVTISTEDRDSGSASKPRIFIIKDINGNAGANNITVSLETSGNIDGAGTAVINANYNSLTIMVDGTNGFII